MPLRDHSETDATLIDALAGVIRNVQTPTRVGDDADALLAELGVGDRDREAMLSAGPKRLLAYHAMANGRLARVCRSFLPRTLAFRGREALTGDVHAFIESRGVHSPFMRDVPAEFVGWVADRWLAEGAPDFLLDLARFELLAEDVPNDPRPVGAATELDVALDKGVRVNGTARLVEFGYAVHEVPEPGDGDPAPALPAPGCAVLVVCRDRTHRYRQVELDALGQALFARLRDGQTLQAAVVGAAADIGDTVGDPLLERATYLLADLADHDVLLGAED